MTISDAFDLILRRRYPDYLILPDEGEPNSDVLSRPAPEPRPTADVPAETAGEVRQP